MHGFSDCNRRPIRRVNHLSAGHGIVDAIAGIDRFHQIMQGPSPTLLDSLKLPAESTVRLAALPAYGGEAPSTIKVIEAFAGARDSILNRITARPPLAADPSTPKWAGTLRELDAATFHHPPSVPSLATETLTTKALGAISGVTVDTDLSLAASQLAASRATFDLQGANLAAEAATSSALRGILTKRDLESAFAGSPALVSRTDLGFASRLAADSLAASRATFDLQGANLAAEAATSSALRGILTKRDLESAFAGSPALVSRTDLGFASRLAADSLAASRATFDLQAINNVVAKAVASSATGGPFTKRALESILASNNFGLLGAGSFPHYDTAALGVLTGIDARTIARQLQGLDGRLARAALDAYANVPVEPNFDPTPAPSAEPHSLAWLLELTPLQLLGWLIFFLSIAIPANDQLEVAKLFHLPTTRFDPAIGVAFICADKLIQLREAKHKL